MTFPGFLLVLTLCTVAPFATIAHVARTTPELAR